MEMLALNFVFSFFLTANGQTDTNLVKLYGQIGAQVKWSTSSRSEVLSKDEAIKRLQQLVETLEDSEIELVHQSDWKNGRCYRVLEFRSTVQNYRIFYYCKKEGNNEYVSKIKVSEV